MEKISLIASFLVFLAMIYFDFFKEDMNLFIPLIVLIILLILSYIFSKRSDSSWKMSKKTSLLFEIAVPTILVATTIVFYLLGGRSQHGINPTNYIIWILYVLSLISAFRNFKKEDSRTHGNLN